MTNIVSDDLPLKASSDMLMYQYVITDKSNYLAFGANTELGISTIRVGTANFKKPTFATASFGAPVSLDLFADSEYGSFKFKADAKCERFISCSPYTCLNISASVGFRFLLPNRSTNNDRIGNFCRQSTVSLKYRNMTVFADGSSSSNKFLYLNLSIPILEDF